MNGTKRVLSTDMAINKREITVQDLYGRGDTFVGETSQVSAITAGWVKEWLRENP